MIRFACECGRQLQAAAAQAGAPAACPLCKRVTVVPDVSTATEHPDPPHHTRPGRDAGHVLPADAPGSAVSEKPLELDFEKRFSRKAVVSFLVAILLAVFCSIPFFRPGTGPENFMTVAILIVVGGGNVVLADRARKEILQSSGRLRGELVARIALVTAPLCLAASMLYPAGIGTWPSPNTQASNNLKQIGLAFHNFHHDYGHFPGSAIRSPDGKPLLSWRVAILPYVDANALYGQFHLHEPWDSPHNLALLTPTPPVYVDGNIERSDGLTRFQVYVGPGTAFENPRGHTLADFADGGSKTLLVTEGEQRVPWTKPIDLPFGPEVMLVPTHVRDLYAGRGFWALSVDGFCHSVPVGAPEETLRALISRNSGEKINWP